MSIDWAPAAKIQHNGVILCGYLPLVTASNLAQYGLPSVSALHLNFVRHQNPAPGDKNVGVFIKCFIKSDGLATAPSNCCFTGFETTQKLFRTTTCRSKNCPQSHQTFGLFFLTSLNVKHLPQNMNPSMWMKVAAPHLRA